MLDASPMAPCRLHWSAGDVEVFHVDLLGRADIEDTAVGWLSAAERARRERFVHSPARRQFTICRAYVRLLLTQRLDCHRSELDFSLGQFGKPSALVRGGVAPVEFNVSHSGSHGLIALSRARPIGIDLEEKRPGLAFSDISESVFSDEECALLREYSAERAMWLFYRIWTLKEAAIKSIGRGFSLAPKTLALPSGLVRGGGEALLDLPRETRAPCPQRLHLYALPDVGPAAAALAIGEPSMVHLGGASTFG
jgi:4'-phosphopantetheinyl transferase